MGWLSKAISFAFPIVGLHKYVWDALTKKAPTPAGRVPQFASYGQPVAIVYGKTRITGNMVYFRKGVDVDLPDVVVPLPGGGSTTLHVTWTGNASILALCEGPVLGLTRIWSGQKVYEVNYTDGATVNDTGKWFTFKAGQRPTQTPWVLMSEIQASAVPVTYPGVAYCAYLTKTEPEAFTGYSFEVTGFLTGTGGTEGDAHPASVLQDLLTNTSYGCGIASSAVVTDVGQNGLTSSSLRSYATAEGFYISPAITERRAAREHLREILDSVNADVVWSEGKFKFFPYGDVAVGSYVPTNTIRYALTNADFLDDENPVTVDIEPDTDRWNIWPVEFLDRSPTVKWKASTYYGVGWRVRNGDRVYLCTTAGYSASSGGPTGTGSSITDNGAVWQYVEEYDKAKAYNVSIVESPEPVDVAESGPRRAPTVTLHSICLRSAAQKISQIRAQKSVRSRASYTFRLGWRFCRLEPMDLVTITDRHLGLNARPVRITSIEEDEEFNLTVTAEEWPFGIAGAVEHETQSSEGEVIWTDADLLSLEPAARDASNVPGGVITGSQLTPGQNNTDNLWPNPTSENAPPVNASDDVLASAEFAWRADLGAGAYAGSWARGVAIAGGATQTLVYDVPCVPGDRFVIEAVAKTATATATVGVTFLNGAGADAGGGGSTATTSATWINLRATSSAAPAGTVIARFYLQGAAASTGSAYFDAIYARRVVSGAMLPDFGMVVARCNFIPSARNVVNGSSLNVSGVTRVQAASGAYVLRIAFERDLIGPLQVMFSWIYGTGDLVTRSAQVVGYGTSAVDVGIIGMAADTGSGALSAFYVDPNTVTGSFLQVVVFGAATA